MSGGVKGQGFSLALHPNTRGFGWVAFEGPFAPHDWGIVYAEKDKNSRCLARLEELLSQLLPDTVVLEEFERKTKRGADRIVMFCRAVVGMAMDRGIEVAIYAKGEVQACFASVGARTRHEIAEAVVRHIDAFRYKLPNKRKPWQGEDRRMSLFAAAALAITHYNLGASRIFDSLSS